MNKPWSLNRSVAPHWTLRPIGGVEANWGRTCSLAPPSASLVISDPFPARISLQSVCCQPKASVRQETRSAPRRLPLSPNYDDQEFFSQERSAAAKQCQKGFLRREGDEGAGASNAPSHSCGDI